MKKLILAFLVYTSAIFCNIAFAAVTQPSIDEMANTFASETDHLDPQVAKLALEAYFEAQDRGIHVNKPILSVIDYSLPSNIKRFWVLDLDNQKVLYSSLVSHGQNSGDTTHSYKFSNQPGSLETSLGLTLTENTYFGAYGYSLKIKGLEPGINNNVYRRTIIIHGAPYVTQEYIKYYGAIGLSWGCPALEQELAKPIIDTIKDGTLVFSYYPDSAWLHKSIFLRHLTPKLS